MKKNTLKAFTLVEMLIVIVIIGILIAALLPRMQAAQGRARDVARKTALSQIQSAIVTHQGDHGSWPWSGTALDTTTSKNEAIGVNKIHDQLINAGMSDVPKDPLNDSSVSGLGGYTATSGNFAYMVSVRNGSNNAGFVLMAKTEVAGGSNRVVCGSSAAGDTQISSGHIGKGADLAQVHPCPTIEKGTTCSNPNSADSSSKCTYASEGELRYIVLY